MSMEIYTKERVEGIFRLRLEQNGRNTTTARMLIKSRPYLAERVMDVQTKFVKMFNGVDEDIKEMFLTSNHLKRLVARVIEKEMQNLLRSLR